jgi:predicted transcriptional regulator
MLPSVKEIAKMRKSLGISQKEIAKVCSVSQSYIARLEKGDINPTYENIRKIYNFLQNRTKRTDNMDIEAKKIMTTKIITCNITDSIIVALDTMKNFGISQLPVVNSEKIVMGTVTEGDINDLLIKGVTPESLKRLSIGRVMSPSLPQLPPNTPISAIYPILRFSNAVLIMDQLSLKGIITKADILKAVEAYAEPGI